MHDMRIHQEKLLTEAEECAVISRRHAADQSKKELFADLSSNLLGLATKVELAIQERQDWCNR
ncbi:hypothetical protein I6F30_09760 [Bradyrhizobium sp. NBAIM20]|uniref:hypothetical protein n=1 Tax=unclassified Bradyrhizobium TaxID=2631580 RepID=UPI001CD47060|nr:MULTISPECIES: hypothetical protein [unclassified Bradyrhizobium]MCA1411435.1 hypothetical protein [Bradyrhizobium sp. NBAIM20]MCA1460703.1 hypothetical protein [Bradyrhizobium sp. NBAIM18]